MTSEPRPTIPQGDDIPGEPKIDESIFAGLTAIDIVEGELVPRRRRPR